MMVYQTYSSEETRQLGERIAQALVGFPPLSEGRLGGVIRFELRKIITPSNSLASAKRLGGAGPSERGRKTRALVIALQGDLGAGKTTFAQGFFKGLGIKKRAVSPTFVIMRRYKIPSVPHNKCYVLLHHMDAYRLRKPEDVTTLGFEKILGDPQNVLLVEWPENIKGALPRSAVKIKFQYGKKENERKIQIPILR
jgi:tRNA threonylcarbamoyladenosine biosynthesis protein TsaE